MPTIPSMPILTEKRTWKRETQGHGLRSTAKLTPQEQTNVRRAVTKLCRGYGSRAALASAMGMSVRALAAARSAQILRTLLRIPPTS